MKIKSNLSFKKFKDDVLNKIEVGQVLLYRPGDIDKKHYDDGIIIEIEKDALCEEKTYHVIWRKEYPETSRTSEWALYSKMHFNPVFYLLK